MVKMIKPRKKDSRMGMERQFNNSIYSAIYYGAF